MGNFKKQKEVKINKPLVLSCFFVYIVVLILLIGLKFGNPRSILGAEYSLDPIQFGPHMQELANYNLYTRFIADFITKDGYKYLFYDAFNNILLFVPFGLAVPILLKKKVILKTILFGFLLSLAFELVQLFTGFGGFQFLDLIANTIGAALGLFLLLLFVRFVKPQRINSIINVICWVCLFIGLPLAILGLYNVIIHADVVAFRFDYGIKTLLNS